MLEKKNQVINSSIDKVNDYYRFIHKSDTEPKRLKKKIKESVKKSIKKQIVSFNRTKKRKRKKNRYN